MKIKSSYAKPGIPELETTGILIYDYKLKLQFCKLQNIENKNRIIYHW